MEQGTNVYSFKVRMDKEEGEEDPSYPRYITLDIVADTRETAGVLLETEMQAELDTFHDDPDNVTWEEILMDVS